MELLMSSVPDDLRQQIGAAPTAAIADSCDALVRHFSNLPLFWERLEQLMSPELTTCAKDAKAAASWKRDGNVAFGASDYNRALSFYTKALRAAPSSMDKSEREFIGTVFVNRAAALHKLGQLERTVEDCDRALEISPKYSKAWYRRARVKYELKDFEGAVSDMKVALAYEPTTGGQSQINVELRRMELERTALDTGCEPRSSSSRGSGVSDVQPQNTEGLQHSSVCWTKEKGWSVAVEADLTVGTLVLQESPYASVLLKHARDTHCHFCFESLPPNPVACSGCAIPLYCTDACKTCASGVETGKSHLQPSQDPDLATPRTDSSESPICELRAGDTKSDGTPRMGEHAAECGGACWSGVLPPDVVLAGRMLRFSLSFEGGSAASKVDRGNLSDALPQVDSLCHHYDQLSADGKLELHVQAIVVTHCMRRPARLKCNVTTIACKLVKLIAQIRVNAMAIHGKPPSPAFGDKSELGFDVVNATHTSVATGVFVLGSRFNHSCVPNVHASFVSGRLFVRTIRQVSKDFALELCYGPELGDLNQQERKEQLQKKYNFSCTCHACSSLTLPDLFLQSFRCSKAGCMGVVLGTPLSSMFSRAHCSPSETNLCALERDSVNDNSTLGSEGVSDVEQRLPEAVDGVLGTAFAKLSLLQREENVGLCLHCGTDVDIDAARKSSLAASHHIERVQELMTEGQNAKMDQEARADGVMRALSRLRGTLHPYNKQLAKAEDVAARVLFTAGQRLSAHKHCRQSIEILEQLYSKQHIVVGNEYIKLASIALLVPLAESTRDSLAAVDMIFTAHYGADYRRMYSFVETLEQMAFEFHSEN